HAPPRGTRSRARHRGRPRPGSDLGDRRSRRAAGIHFFRGERLMTGSTAPVARIDDLRVTFATDGDPVAAI
ncbi:hypothetical protein ACSTK0_24020, partial [Vibrio parahaemolyticus]